MSTTIQQRRGTAAAWAAANPVLAAGEPGFETDTGKLKVGDGTSHWSVLSYFINQSQLAAAYVAAFKPEAYGPVGTSDDTATLTAMFAAACAASNWAAGVIPTVVLDRQHVVSGSGTIFTLTAGVELTGTGGLLVKGANGPYEAIIGCGTHDVSGLSVHGLTFDGGNSANALTAGQITDSVITTGDRIGLTFRVGTGISVRNNRFTDFDCMWVINSEGCYAVSIIDNTFDTIGNHNSSLIHDSSSIYVDAFGLEIAGNFLSASAPGESAAVNYGCRTAIEAHGSNVNVHDNNILAYQDSGQLSSSLWTISENFEWHHNNAYGVQIGVALTPYSAMSNVSIHNNNIEIDYLAWYNTVPGSFLGGAGVIFQPDPVGANFSFTGLSIKDNQVVFRQAVLTGRSEYITSTVSGGVVFARSDGGTLVDRDIDISGNTITGAVDNGIHLFLDNADGLKVCGNTIRDANTSASSSAVPYSYGMYLVSSGQVSNARIDSNAVIDDQSSSYHPYGNTAATIAHGYVLSPAASVAARAYDNSLSVASGSVPFMALGAPFDVVPKLMPLGAFYSPARATLDVTAYGANLATAAPVDLGYGELLIIGCEVVTAAGSSSVRLGIYADNGKGRPGVLVLDAGTVPATTTGVKTITISQPVAAGKYWLVAVPQSGVPALRILATGTAGDMPLPNQADASAAGLTGVYKTGISGALPTPFGAPTDAVGAYMVFVGT